jgi:hypothetical protein
MTDLDAPIPLMPDELDHRMDARRAARKQPLGAGTILVLVAAAVLYVYVVWVTVWGVMA